MFRLSEDLESITIGNMPWDIETVRKKLGGKLIGHVNMREKVCQSILLLPRSMGETVCTSIWFISSQDDAWAFTFRGSDIADKHLIFLSDELFKADDRQITYTILHEIGHVLRNHHNALNGYTQTESEIKRQEREADEFAQEILKGLS